MGLIFVIWVFYWPVHGSHTKIIWNCLRAPQRAKISAIGVLQFEIKL